MQARWELPGSVGSQAVFYFIWRRLFRLRSFVGDGFGDLG